VAFLYKCYKTWPNFISYSNNFPISLKSLCPVIRGYHIDFGVSFFPLSLMKTVSEKACLNCMKPSECNNIENYQ